MQHHDGIKHKAHFQLTYFVSSDDYYTHDLTPDDLAILFIISRYLDMPKNVCCLKQVNLAKECRMSERQLRKRTAFLVSQKLLIRYTRGKLYYYEMGEAITGYV